MHRRVVEHLQRPIGVRGDPRVGNAVEIVDAECDEGARHERRLARVGLVLVVIVDDLREVVEGLGIVVGHAVARRVHLAELPLRQRFAALGSILQGGDGGAGVTAAHAFEAGAKGGLGILEDRQRRAILAGGPVEGAHRGGEGKTGQQCQHGHPHRGESSAWPPRCRHRHASRPSGRDASPPLRVRSRPSARNARSHPSRSRAPGAPTTCGALRDRPRRRAGRSCP